MISFGKALNPPIYLISVLPAISVLTLAAGSNALWVAVAGAGVVLLQHGVNVLNDVTDWCRGADVEKADSWIRYHRGELRTARLHGLGSLAAGFIVGGLASVGSGHPGVLLAAAPLVALGALYNSGSKPLAYGSLGEWVTALCYGPGVIGGLLWIAQGRIGLNGAALAAAYALLSVAVLLSHQPPQILTDAVAGKRSFAVRHGARATFRTSAGLAAGAAACLGLAHRQAGLAILSLVLAANFVLVRPSPKNLLLRASALVALAALFTAGGI